MPSEEFPQQKQKELTQEQLERVLEVKIEYGTSLKELFDSIKADQTLQFIVTENFDIFITNKRHAELVERLKVEKENLLINDGSFYLDPALKEIDFTYWFNEIKVKYLREAAENKIKEFLKFQGVEIL